MTPEQHKQHMADLQLLASACLERYKQHGIGSELIQSNGYRNALEKLQAEEKK